MKLWVLVLCSIAGAQTPTPNASPKLEPYQVKALENALGMPNSGSPLRFSGPFSAAPPSLIFASAPAPVDVGKTCAIPLLSIPIDPDVDRGIRRELKPDASHGDRMPIFEGLPTCGQENSAVRSFTY
jgi:hypothetical protein